MNVPGTTTTYGVSNSASVLPKKDLGKDDFMQLLTTQLRAQDPLKPMDSTEFTAQLAQFSSLEQLSNINTQLKDMTMYQSSLQNTMTSSMIGKRVRLANDEVHAVTGVLFENNLTYLQLDSGSRAQLGEVKEILGGI